MEERPEIERRMRKVDVGLESDREEERSCQALAFEDKIVEQALAEARRYDSA